MNANARPGPSNTRPGPSNTKWRALLLAIAALASVLLPAMAEARSGGSFGGGFRRSSSSSFGSSSRSFGSSSWRPSSYSSSTYRPSSYSSTHIIPIPIGGFGYGYGYGHSYGAGHYSYGSGGSVRGLLTLLVVIGVVAIVVFLIVRWRRRVGLAADEKTMACDVVQVTFGIQQSARALQDRLEKMATTADTGNEEGLARMVREVAMELRRVAARIEYAALLREPGVKLLAAESRFGSLTSDARTKYDREVVRGDGAGVRHQEKEVKTDGLRDEDGDIAVSEFFVVTLICALRNMALPERLGSNQDLESLLRSLSGASADQVVAAEVVWSPAALSDSMSRSDMEEHYPDLMTV
ncbi:MAG: DUF1517 domain-containing protein [Myxococcales bacterium]|nr:DUF1517 domain-containing protein [Myxococcales bacterium]